MDYLNNPARAALIQQTSRVSSLAEVHAAQTALRVWRQQHPEDWGILDAGEELSLLEDAYLEDDSPPGQSPSWTEWQRLEYAVMGARTVPAIISARRDLKQWVQQRPEEVSSEYLDALFMLMEVVEEQVGESNTSASRERELVELA
jgi:hypothetical protein